MSSSWLRGVVRIGCLVLPAVSALAQVTLNFDNLALADYGDIPASYGDGLDPNVPDIQYRTFNVTTGATLSTNLDFWNTSYGDLTKIAFATSDGAGAEIAFVPAAGFAVRLVSFDMAGWPTADLSNSTMRLVDASNNVLLNFAALGPVAIQGDNNGARHSTFTPNFTFAGTLRLQWGTDWDVGIDNIVFQAVAVPEPATWVLLALGSGPLALAARKRWRGRS